MTLQMGVNSNVAYKVESVFGTKPSPATGAQYLRRVSISLSLRKDTYQSNEIRSDRQIADFRHGMRHAEGELAGELSLTSYDDMIEGALCGTWAATTAIGPLTTISATASSKTIARSAGSFLTAGLKVGDVVRMTGWATGGYTAMNSKNLRVASIAANGTSFTVAESGVIVDATAGDSVTITVVGKKCLNGTTIRSFSVECGYTDIAKYQMFTGTRLGRMAFALPPTGMAGVTFGFMGQDAEDYAGTQYFTTPTAATTTAVLAAVNGTLRIGGVDIGNVTNLDITLDNNPSTQATVGSNKTPDVFLGRSNVTGTATILLSDTAIPVASAFNNETEMAIQLKMDVAMAAPADFHSIFLPRVKFGGADIRNQGEQGIPITLPFQALVGNTADTDAAAIVYQRSNT